MDELRLMQNGEKVDIKSLQSATDVINNLINENLCIIQPNRIQSCIEIVAEEIYKSKSVLRWVEQQ